MTLSPPALRSFLALPISGKLKEEFKHILGRLQQTRADVRWVKSENVHVTLKFLGDLPESTLEKVSSLLSELSPGFFPFRSYLTRLGAFPNLRHPKILWGVLDDSERKIQSIVEVLENRLVLCGIAPDDHPFKPHVTVGRIRSPSRLKNLIDTLAPMTFDDKIGQRFDKIVLYKSTLTPQGPVYEVLKEFEMGGI